MEKLYRMGSSPHIRTKENVEKIMYDVIIDNQSVTENEAGRQRVVTSGPYSALIWHGSCFQQ